MKRTHLLFMYDISQELRGLIDQEGPIKCFDTPPIYLCCPLVLQNIPTSDLLPFEAVRELKEFRALSCEYDPSTSPPWKETEIEHHIETVAIALQLVKPTADFCTYRLQLDADTHVKIKFLSSDTRLLPARGQSPYLQYQQHHTVSSEDLQRAVKILPAVSKALASDPAGSWGHPYASVHRALIFFSQGYSVNLEELRQVLWAAALDCLFASKLDRTKQGAKAISMRLQKLWGPNFEPYCAPTVKVPLNQKRPCLRLQDIGEHIFWLRNAYMHGGPMPDPNWLSNRDDRPESGYAYQLLEYTEILLRETLLRLFEDSSLLSIFLNPEQLDSYFP